MGCSGYLRKLVEIKDPDDMSYGTSREWLENRSESVQGPIHFLVDQSVIFKVVQSVSETPAYRLWADDYAGLEENGVVSEQDLETARGRIFDDFARATLDYLEWIFLPGVTVHMVMEKGSSYEKVTKDSRGKTRAKILSAGLSWIFYSTRHGHLAIGQEKIDNALSLTAYAQQEIMKRIISLHKGTRPPSYIHRGQDDGHGKISAGGLSRSFRYILFLSLNPVWVVTGGEADSGMVTVSDGIKAREPDAFALCVTVDSDLIVFPLIGVPEDEVEIPIDAILIPQARYIIIILLYNLY